jgi:hypothetical protein
VEVLNASGSNAGFETRAPPRFDRIGRDFASGGGPDGPRFPRTWRFARFNRNPGANLVAAIAALSTSRVARPDHGQRSPARGPLRRAPSSSTTFPGRACRGASSSRASRATRSNRPASPAAARALTSVVSTASLVVPFAEPRDPEASPYVRDLARHRSRTSHHGRPLLARRQNRDTTWPLEAHPVGGVSCRNP